MLYSALAAVLAVVALSGGCNVQLHDGYRVNFENMGRDPIHVGGVRCAQNTNENIAHVGGEYEKMRELKLSRNDINLGTLRLRENVPARGKNTVVITMTEPVYFDFQFECNDTMKVLVEYIKP